MCDRHVIDTVKRKMLSRRSTLRTTPPENATGPSLVMQKPARVIDLTYPLDAGFPTWDGSPGFSSRQLENIAEDGFNVFELRINEHTGTHIDAPLHASADGISVEQIPPENLICPLCVVDIREKAAGNPDAALTPDDLKDWIAAHGGIPPGALVAMNSGWQAHVSGPKFRNADDDGVQHYPGFHEEAALMLLEETGAAAIGVDTLSLDTGATRTYGTHYAWLPSGRYGIEAMANLDQLPATGATLFTGAPTHTGGSGGPARLLALV